MQVRGVSHLYFDIYVEGELGGKLSPVKMGGGSWLDNMPIEEPRLTPQAAYEKLEESGQREHAFQFVALHNTVNPAVGQHYNFSNDPKSRVATSSSYPTTHDPWSTCASSTQRLGRHRGHGA